MESPMEVTCDYILEIILENLPHHDLNSCMLVNKRWYNLIKSSSSIMQNVPLYLRGNWKRKNHFLRRMDYRFQKIVIKDVTRFSKRSLKVFKKHRNTVKEIEFRDCVFDDIDDIRRILSRMPNLETLKMFSVEIFSEDVKQTINLPLLKLLCIIESSLDILAVIKSTQLNNLMVKCGSSDCYAIGQLANFLKIQTKLKSLSLRSLELDEELVFATNIATEIQFKLKKLSLERITLESCANDNIFRFLRSQTEVEEMELGREFPDEVFQIVLTEMPNLKSLSIRGAYIPGSAGFYKKLSVNKSMERLVVHGGFLSTEIATALICILPNLKEIKFIGSDYSVTEQFLADMTANLAQLESLHLSKATKETLEKIRFNKLKSVHVDYAGEVSCQVWKTFTRNHPSIETLSIRYATNPIGDKIMNIVTKNLKRLKHLKIGTGFKGTKKSVAHINRNCKHLKVVEILKDSMKNSKITSADMKGIKINGFRWSSFEDIEEAFKGVDNEWARLNVPIGNDMDSSWDSDEYGGSDDEFGINMNMMQLLDLINDFDSDEDDRYGYYYDNQDFFNDYYDDGDDDDDDNIYFDY